MNVKRIALFLLLVFVLAGVVFANRIDNGEISAELIDRSNGTVFIHNGSGSQVTVIIEYRVIGSITRNTP